MDEAIGGCARLDCFNDTIRNRKGCRAIAQDANDALRIANLVEIPQGKKIGKEVSGKQRNLVLDAARALLGLRQMHRQAVTTDGTGCKSLAAAFRLHNKPL